VRGFLGKIFDNPGTVFTEAILKPETQGLEIFVDGVNNIVEAQQRVAQRYLEDGSIEDACPPLQALLHIMASGEYQGMDVHHPGIRVMFTREYLLQADWYRERLKIKQSRDIVLMNRHVSNLRRFLDDTIFGDEAARLGIGERLEVARKKLMQLQSENYLQELVGTIGADPLRPAQCLAEQQAVDWNRVDPGVPQPAIASPSRGRSAEAGNLPLSP
jgi:hypothetical protein